MQRIKNSSENPGLKSGKARKSNSSTPASPALEIRLYYYSIL